MKIFTSCVSNKDLKFLQGESNGLKARSYIQKHEYIPGQNSTEIKNIATFDSEFKRPRMLKHAVTHAMNTIIRYITTYVKSYFLGTSSLQGNGSKNFYGLFRRSLQNNI